MSSTLLKNQHLNLCLSDYVADIKLHTIIIKCRLSRYNSAVEADVIDGKLHPKLCHLKHLSVQFSANKIKSSEYFSKQPTQLIVALNSSLRHIFVTFALLDHPMYMIRYHFGRLVMCMCVIKPKIFSLANLKRVFVFVFVARV